MERFRGRRMLVTGRARGIGAGAVARMRDDRAVVTILDLAQGTTR